MEKYLELYQQEIKANPFIDDMRFMEWLQVKLLMEINNKLDKLLDNKTNES